MFPAQLSRLGRALGARGMHRGVAGPSDKTRLGAYLRAGTENPALVQAFGINVPRMIIPDLCLRRRVGGIRRRARGADLPGQRADGLQPDDYRVCRGGDRRHGLDHRLGVNRPRPRRGRRPDQGVLYLSEASSTVIFIIMAIVAAPQTRRLFREDRMSRNAIWLATGVVIGRADDRRHLAVPPCRRGAPDRDGPARQPERRRVTRRDRADHRRRHPRRLPAAFYLVRQRDRVAASSSATAT